MRRRSPARPLPPRPWPAVRGSSLLSQRVADAAHRVNQARLAAGFGLPPQIADVDVERIGSEAEVVAPHALEDDRARQHLARVAQEQLEEREFRPRQLDQAAAAT